MAITLQSHQLSIHDYAIDMEKELNQVEDNSRDCLFGWIDRQLELKIWTAKDGSWKAELLLAYGGPTVTIELDSRYTFGTLNHSWGANAMTGEAQLLIEFQHRGLKDAILEIARLG